MRKKIFLILALVITLILALSSNTVQRINIPFNTKGGLDGKIIKVTNLNSKGPGSFKEALDTKGKRIIVFEVSGIIDLERETITITEPYASILGQTAPTGGITVIKGGMLIKTHDIVMQHLRFRMGDANQPKKSGFEPDVSIYGEDAYNIVIDHCSFAWGVDENLSVSGPRFNGKKGTARNIILSHNIIAEGLYNSSHSKGEHSMGTLVHDNCSNIEIIANLYAHNSERNPWFKGSTTGSIINNVIYNPSKWAIRLGYVEKEWIGQKVKPEAPKVTIVGNFFKHGIDTPDYLAFISTSSIGEAYMNDNIVIKKDGSQGIQTYGNIKKLSKRPYFIKEVNELKAIDTVEYVIKNAGARPKDRDEVDKRIIEDFLSNKGKIIDSQNDVGGYPLINSNYRVLPLPENNKIEEWIKKFTDEVE